MKVDALKVMLPFPAGKLPKINPNDPHLLLEFGGIKIHARFNSKSVRKLNLHIGSDVLQGRLLFSNGAYVLMYAGFQLIEPREPEPMATPPTLAFQRPPRAGS
jgi:hypothetical protein